MLSRRPTRGYGGILKHALVIVIVFGAAVTGIAAAMGTFDPRTPELPATFAVLQDAPTLLPPGSRTPMMRDAGLDPVTDARLAYDQGGLQLYVVRPGNGELLCFTVRESTSSINTCRTKSTLMQNDAIWISRARPGQVYDLYGLVSDGFNQAQVGGHTTSIERNVFAVQDVPASVEDVVLNGLGNPVNIGLGPQVPSGVTIVPDPGS